MVEEIRFDKRNFNPLYFHIKKYMNDPTVARILIYGSSSAAKTYSINQNLVIQGFEKKYNSMVFRKEASNLKDTLKNDLVTIIDSILKKEPLNNIYRRMDFEFRSMFGNVIRLRGLDKSDKIKGLSGFTKVYLDELDQYTFENYKEMKRRLRGRKNQQMIASWNPVNEKHWIKTEIIDKMDWIEMPKDVDGDHYSKLSDDSFVRMAMPVDDGADDYTPDAGRTILIKTVFADNKWIVGGTTKKGLKYGRIDHQAITTFKEMKAFYPYDWRVYGLGEWGIIRPDQPYFNNYDDALHYNIKYKFNIEPRTDTWLTFDFNYNPCTARLYQVRPGLGVVALREYVQKGGIRALCEHLKEDDEFMGIDFMMLRVTGDSNGNSHTATGGNKTAFQIIAEELDLGQSRFVRTGGDKLVNDLLVYSRRVNDEFFYKIPFFIDYRCTGLRDDLLMAKEGNDGGVFKDRKAGYAMDHLDNHRYFVHALCPGGKTDIMKLKNMLE